MQRDASTTPSSLEELLNPRTGISSLGTFLHIFWLRRWPVVITWLVLGVPLAAFLVAYDIPRSYQAEIYLRFPKIVGAQHQMVRDVAINEEESIVLLFSSNRVMSRTIDNNKLLFRILTKHVYRPQVFKKIDYDERAVLGNYFFKFKQNRHLEVRFQGKGDESPRLVFNSKVNPNEPVKMAGLRLFFNPSAFSNLTGHTIQAGMTTPRNVQEGMSKRLKVEPLDRGRDKVNYLITLEDRDPFMVAGILNDLVESFLEVYTGTTQSQDMKVIAQMEENLKLAREKEKAAEQRLARFMVKFPALTDQKFPNTYSLIQAENEKERLLEQRNQLDLIWNQRPNPPNVKDSPMWLQDAIYLLNSMDVLQAKSHQLKLEQWNRRKEELGNEVATTQHPKFQSLEREILEIQPSVEALIRDRKNTIINKLRGLAREIAKNVPQNVPVSVELEAKRLQAEKESASRVVENLQQEYDRAKLATSQDFFKISVVDQAQPPNYIQPSLMFRLAFSAGAFMLSIFPGLLFFGFKQLLFGKIWTLDDADRKLGGKVIGTLFYIPSISAESQDNPGREFESRLLNPAGSISKISAQNYQRVLAESENLFEDSDSNVPYSMVVTSAIPGEGKSLLSSNLAIQMARSRRRTLLVDADLYHGSLHKVFQVPPEPGLFGTVNSNFESLDQVIWDLRNSIRETNRPGVSILPIGREGPPMEGIEFSSQVIDGLQALAKEFHLVIDTPPVLVTSDALLIMERIQNVLFVIRSGFAATNEIKEAYESVRRRETRIGLVVNAVQESPFAKNPHTNYKYYYQ